VLCTLSRNDSAELLVRAVKHETWPLLEAPEYCLEVSDMGNGLSYPPTNSGSLKALPERLDIHQAKDAAGDKWDKQLFDCLATGGTVTREQFFLAPLLNRRMFIEAVRIAREDISEEAVPSWYPIAPEAKSLMKDVLDNDDGSPDEAGGDPVSSQHFDVEFFRALEAGRPLPGARDPLQLGMTIAGLRRHREQLKSDHLPAKPLEWRQKVTGCRWEGSGFQHQAAVLHAVHDLNGSVCEAVEASEESIMKSETAAGTSRPKEVDIANIFVSFWLASDFDEVLDVLERYLKAHNLDPGKCYFWIFDYSMRHHGANLSDKLVREVSAVIQRIGHTVLVVPDDYSTSNIYLGDEPPSPRTLLKTPSNFVRTLRLPVVKRTWCAWEVYCASKAVEMSRGIFRIAGTEAWDDAFRDAILERRDLTFKGLVAAFTGTEIENAHTSRGEDKRAILHAIGEQIPHHGHQVVDTAVNKLMVQELYSRALGVLSTLPSLSSASIDNRSETREVSNLIEHVAHLLEVLGRHEEAASMYSEALEGARAYYGDFAELTLRRFHILGDLKRRGGGKLGDGEPLLRKALEGRVKLFGARGAVTLETHFALAELLLRKGNLDASETMHRFIRDARRAENRTSPASVESTEALAKVLKALGRYDEALELLDSYPQVKAESDLTTVVAMNCYERGKVSEALTLLQEECKNRKIYLGDEHPDTLQSMNNTAFLLQRGSGDAAGAEALFRKALEGRRKVLGNQHPDTHNSLYALADCYMKLGRLDDALPLYREELIASKALLGDDHPDTQVSLRSMEGALALTLKRAKHAAHGHEHLPEAERLFKAVITCQRPALGDQHHDTIASIGALSHVLKKQHKLTEALPLYREVAAYHRATSGGTDPETLHHIFELAELLKHQHHVTGQPHGNGDDLEAEALYREVIKGRQAVLGYTNSKTMETIKHLAVLLRHMPGRHAEAEQLMIEVEGT
jgi:tetratricopeptide (TPR) repeat protein